MFYRRGKNSEKPQKVWQLPSPLYVRGLKTKSLTLCQIYAHKDKTRKKYMPDNGF